MEPVIGIVGAGKVGSTLARLWHSAGFTIAAVYSRGDAKKMLASKVNSLVVDRADKVVERSDLVVLSVPDGMIRAVAEEITTVDLSAKAIVHVSGALGAEQLASLGMRGAMTGSLHPVFPFASVEESLTRLPGSSFAIEAESPTLQSWLRELVAALDGQIIVVPPGKKALYHAALVIASNYTVVLYGTAERLLTQLGGSQEAIRNALQGLIAATLSNLAAYRAAQALTGPLVRGDLATLEAHMNALKQMPDVAELYRVIAQLSFPLLREREISEEQMRLIIQSLNRT
jgi:predicted short-subunit dehydrogenase-like oxidoreductase (DUF2520 family)